MLSYSKGSDILVYCRVCPKPSFPSYHKKGMLPHLQGTIKLKVLSRLFGRTPRLQGRSAWAERPVCRHISATLLTLQGSQRVGLDWATELTDWLIQQVKYLKVLWWCSFGEDSKPVLHPSPHCLFICCFSATIFMLLVDSQVYHGTGGKKME